MIKRKETLFIAEVRDDGGGNTPGYITTYFTEVILGVVLTVAVLACLLSGGAIIYKSKEILLTLFNLAGHKLSDIFFIIIDTSYVHL